MARSADDVTFSRLYVLWSEPSPRRRRHIIGQLWRSAEGAYAFAYEPELHEALKAGFSLLAEFPEHRQLASPYVSTALFSTFAQRVPSSRRPDYAALVASWGVEHTEDPLEILALSGGVQLTDRLELCEYRPVEDDLSRPLVFRVAGEQFYSGGAKLSPGERVTLTREADSIHDRHATQVRITAGDLVGYVPRQYSCLIARLLDAGTRLDAFAVRHLVLPQDRDRWVVLVQRAG